jgi:hypothetical protein
MYNILLVESAAVNVWLTAFCCDAAISSWSWCWCDWSLWCAGPCVRADEDLNRYGSDSVLQCLLRLLTPFGLTAAGCMYKYNKRRLAFAFFGKTRLTSTLSCQGLPNIVSSVMTEGLEVGLGRNARTSLSLRKCPAFHGTQELASGLCPLHSTPQFGNIHLILPASLGTGAY